MNKNKKFLVPMIASALFSIGISGFSCSQNVMAATTADTSTASVKNAAGLMDFIAKKGHLTAAQKSEAKKAAKMLRTGELGNQTAPSWFKTYVSLSDADDATSSSNVVATIANLEQVNKERAAIGKKKLKISLISTAISMIDCDYQKRDSLVHPQYYKHAGNIENLAAGSDPVSMWMNEKANWQWDVQKSPSLARYQFSPNWNSAAYNHAVLGTNGYKTVGHYTNIVNKKHRVMGMAHMTKNPTYGYADAYNATSKGAKSAITLAKYKSLVNKWLVK